MEKKGAQKTKLLTQTQISMRNYSTSLLLRYDQCGKRQVKGNGVTKCRQCRCWPCVYIMFQCRCSNCQRNRFILTVSCLRYLFSSAPECEGCALSPDAPALPGSQLLPINDSSTQTGKCTEGTSEY